MYVGMTRAMERLFLSHAVRRRWQGHYREQTPSRFLAEVPDAQRIRRREEPVRDEGRGWGDRTWRRRRDRDDGTYVEYEDGYGSQAASRKPARSSAFNPSLPRSPHAGKRVRHELFGVGTVRAAEGEGEQMKLTVAFPGAGVKKILARYVEWIDSADSALPPAADLC
jgi:DNA helicase-2/ATP-dependent DNA helicase PcrA